MVIVGILAGCSAIAKRNFHPSVDGSRTGLQEVFLFRPNPVALIARLNAFTYKSWIEVNCPWKQLRLELCKKRRIISNPASETLLHHVRQKCFHPEHCLKSLNQPFY
jgi:hypothetical protein